MGKNEKNGEQHVQAEKVSIEQQLTREEAVSYLECVLSGLKEGSITLENEGRSVTLPVAESVTLELELKRKGPKNKMEFEISWVEEVQPAEAQEAQSETAPETQSEATAEAAEAPDKASEETSETSEEAPKKGGKKKKAKSA